MDEINEIMDNEIMAMILDNMIDDDVNVHRRKKNRRRRKKNKWEVMRDFLNKKGTGYWLTRGELISDLNISISTIDKYRNYLTQAGYLSKRARGVYIIEKEIPIMSLTDIRNETDPFICWVENDQNNYSVFQNNSSSSDFITTKKPKKDFLTKKDFEL